MSSNSNKTKKLKMDHEPIRAMAEALRKIYLEAHQKAAAQRRAPNGPSKKSEPGERNPGLPSVNGITVPELVSPPPPPPTTPTNEERLAAENLERLLASVMDPVESLSPPPKAATNQSLPPSPIACEDICQFHPEAELQPGTSAKGWAYVGCPELKCPYLVPAAEVALISEMMRNQLHEEIAGGP